MIAPLRKKTLTGALLFRRQETLTQIERFQNEGTDYLLRSAQIGNRNSPNFVRPETLLFFLRDSRKNNNDQLFGALYALLYDRLEIIANKGRSPKYNSASGALALSLEAKRDAILDKFNLLISRDREGYEEKLDYYEVNFDQAAANLRKDAEKMVRRKIRREQSLPDTEDPEGVNPEILDAVSKLSTNDLSAEERATYRNQVLPAIDSLPEDERRVMTMLIQGYAIESNKAGERTISSVLGCTPKTVWNRRDRALQKLRAALGVDL